MDDEAKKAAISAGEAAGYDAARKLFSVGGIAAIAGTLKPGKTTACAKSFYELWDGGDEKWSESVQSTRLAAKSGVGPYHVKAFDTAYATAARRWCEILIRGYVDAHEGVPFSGPQGDSVKDLEIRLALLKRRTVMGEAPALIDAYELGYKLHVAQENEDG